MKTNSNKNKIEEDKLITNPLLEFINYMKKLIKKKGMNKRDVFYLSDIPVNYGYKLLLEMPELYTRIKRDKIIAEAFKKKLKNIDAFNEFLIKNNVEQLKSCGEDKDI